MKIALITDTHWGVRNDHAAFIENNKRFLDEVFFPKIDELDIKKIVHLGDVVDRRKYVNFMTARRLRLDFIEPIYQREIELDVILGNHDVFFKNTNEVNSIVELLGRYENINIYDTADEVKLGDLKVLYVPWLCDSNGDASLQLIEETDAQVCMGHLEIDGFEMYKGNPSHGGIPPSIFDKFDMTLSGHFHHPSENNGIRYLGAASEQTWSDYDDDRGFHIFDTETRTLEFIANPFTMFEKIHYDNGAPESSVANKFVKVIVRDKSDPVAFESFIDRLEKQGPCQIQVVDDHLNLNLPDDETLVDEAEDTLTIFKRAVSQANKNQGFSPKKLDSFVVELYQEALAVE